MLVISIFVVFLFVITKLVPREDLQADQLGAARMVKEEFIRSSIKVDNVNWRAAALYLALKVLREELQANTLGATRMVKEELIRSSIKVDNINWRQQPYT